MEFSFLQILVAAIGLGAWCRWLWMKTKTPRLLCAFPIFLTVLSVGAFCVSIHGLSVSFGALGLEADSTQKAKALADGISEAMYALRLGTLFVVVCVASLLGLTWRYRWSKRNVLQGQESEPRCD